MSIADEEESHYEEEEGETQLLNAEEVTLIATNFLRRLGNKHGPNIIRYRITETFSP